MANGSFRSAQIITRKVAHGRTFLYLLRGQIEHNIPFAPLPRPPQRDPDAGGGFPAPFPTNTPEKRP